MVVRGFTSDYSSISFSLLVSIVAWAVPLQRGVNVLCVIPWSVAVVIQLREEESVRLYVGFVYNQAQKTLSNLWFDLSV